MNNKFCIDITDKLSIIYEIVEEDDKKVIAIGRNWRIIKEILKENVREVDFCEVQKEDESCQKYAKKLYNRHKRNNNFLLGTILHFDGDEHYLNKTMELYNEMGFVAYGLFAKEKEMKAKIKMALNQVIPDVIVITGHDSYNNKGKKDITNYTNTQNFIDAIKEARRMSPNSVIVAGACQSHYESLIANGASFASSPARINVHTYDPAVIAIIICSTSISQKVNFEEILKFIDGKRQAFGGVETYGKMKMIL